eukprot:TRINITY_DN10629_c0_g1_i3.p1 TRINITY_DN10629_c0_g1~~TRINITY_DN10629_c0_g1_i3.p1  ORF type:complete len:568 (+),score=115.56 TRINITY_DN10629_c0_g1_i3:107-1810(+)
MAIKADDATLLDRDVLDTESSDDDELIADQDDLKLIGLSSRSQLAAEMPLWRLYVSHGFTAWTMRMWEFAVALMLMAVDPDSMLLPAVYSLVISVAVTLFSTPIGQSVDRSSRLRTVQRSLAAIKIGFGVSAILVWMALKQERSAAYTRTISGLIILFTTLGHLGYIGNRLSVEKDWVVAIVGEKNEEKLSQVNAILRRIDLSCKLLGPMAAGFIMSFAGMQTGALAIAIWNIGSGVPEYWLIKQLYNSAPVLAQRPPTPDATTTRTRLSSVFSTFADLYGGWRVYTQQITLRPGIGLALLYSSVLQMGPVMTAYTYYRGVSEATLGAVRGLGAVFGISATFVFPYLERRYGLARTGLLAIWTQVAFLTLSFLSVLVASAYTGDCSDPPGQQSRAHCLADRNFELGLLFAGTIACRIGLWGYDLAVSQMLQQCIPTKLIGSINGTQAALNTLFEMVSPLLGIIFSKPDQFYILIIVSYSLIGLAAIVYSSFYADVRDDKLMQSKSYEVLLSKVDRMLRFSDDDKHDKSPDSGADEIQASRPKTHADKSKDITVTKRPNLEEDETLLA